MPALLRGMAPLIPMVAGRRVKSNKGQPPRDYGQTATIEFAHFPSSHVFTAASGGDTAASVLVKIRYM